MISQHSSACPVNKKLSPRNIPQSTSTNPSTTSRALPGSKDEFKAAKPHNHTYNPLPPNPGSPPKKDHPQTKPTNLRSPSHTPHQHTSEAHLSSHISTHPKLISQVPQNSHQNSGYQSTSQISQSGNQSGQPSFSIIIIQNTPKINLNITQKHHTLSKTASIPNPLTTPPKKLTPPTSSAAPMPHHLPAKPPLPHTPKKQNGQSASGAAAWSGPGASE